MELLARLHPKVTKRTKSLTRTTTIVHGMPPMPKRRPQQYARMSYTIAAVYGCKKLWVKQ